MIGDVSGVATPWLVARSGGHCRAKSVHGARRRRVLATNDMPGRGVARWIGAVLHPQMYSARASKQPADRHRNSRYMSLRIGERRTGDVTIVDLHGTITAGDTTIRDTMTSLVARGVRWIVLNFADVSYMDSMGLSALVGAHLMVRRSDARLVLLHVPRHIAALLTTTRLSTVFDIFDDEAVAIRDIRDDRQGTPVPTSPP